eukprot:1719189-Prymnesium_polylepis.1
MASSRASHGACTRRAACEQRCVNKQQEQELEQATQATRRRRKERRRHSQRPLAEAVRCAPDG